LTVSKAHEAFNPDGSLAAPFFEKQLIGLMNTFVEEMRMRVSRKEETHVDAST
jgi:hypothetical protein